MIVLSRPSLSLARLIRSIAGPTPAAAPAFSDLRHHARGRDALRAALTSFGLRCGDTVVLPAYMCDSLAQAVQTAGLAVHYIDVEPDLRLSPARLHAAIQQSGAKAALMVHYFGLAFDAAPLRRVCRDAGVPLIEDCCHGFLSRSQGRWIGSDADAAIFSMRKTLPIPDGGALRMSPLSGPSAVDPPSSSRPPIARYALTRLLEGAARTLGWPNPYASGIDAWRARRSNARGLGQSNAPSGPLGAGVPALPQHASVLLAGFLADEAELLRLAQQIVCNHERLIAGARLRGWQPFLSSLPEGSVPQWALLDDPDGNLVGWLRNQGIGASRWPGRELPSAVRAAPQEFPNSLRLDRRLALLPVHQSIDGSAIDRTLLLLDAAARRRDASGMPAQIT